MHAPDGLDDLAQEPLFGAAHRDDDAELRGARVARRTRRFEDLVDVEEGEHVDAGVEAHRLRAERAVFGAGARLGVDEALELDLGPAPREPHLVGERDQRRQLVEREARDCERFLTGQVTVFVEQGAFGVDERHRGHGGIVPIDGCARPLGPQLVSGAAAVRDCRCERGSTFS